MVLWICLALMTGAAVMAVLWPLSARAVAAGPDGSDVSFYKQQLCEIDRDVERSLIGPSEAEAARTEAGHRILRAAASADNDPVSTGEPALRRRRAASALALSIVPIVGLALYGALGSPALVGRPAPALGGDGDLTGALTRIETHLAAQPEDGRGWGVVAPVYLRLGRFDDAAKAFRAALRLGGETPERFEGYGEALVAAGGGVVSAEARSAFASAFERESSSVKASYYLALADEQDGNTDGARTRYRHLLDRAAADAPWREAVRARLADLDGTPAGTPPELSPEIAAMVSGLDERLSRDGGSEAEWARLIRSYVVLGQPDRAKDRLGRATLAFAGDDEAARRLRALTEGLSLDRTGNRP